MMVFATNPLHCCCLLMVHVDLDALNNAAFVCPPLKSAKSLILSLSLSLPLSPSLSLSQHPH
jgi:hypothetical protein